MIRICNAIAIRPKSDQALVVALERAGEIGERRDDEKLPRLPNSGGSVDRLATIFLAAAGEGEQRLSLPRGRAPKAMAGNLVVERRDVPQLDAARLVGVGLATGPSAAITLPC